MEDAQDDGELEINMDVDGRLGGVTGLRYPTAATLDTFISPVQAAAVQHEILRIHALDVGDGNSDGGSDDSELDASFWLPAAAAEDGMPRTTLESLAAAVFKLHTSGAQFDADRSGAEWWFQVRDTADDGVPAAAAGGGSGNARAAVDVEVDVNEPSIPFHWDKDEVMAGAFGVWLHPQLST